MPKPFAMLMGLVYIVAASGLSSDPNAQLFAHMLPIFQKEEQLRFSSHPGEFPVLPNETEHSLTDAKLKLDKLVSLGHLSTEKAGKLLDALSSAEKIRHVAKMLESYDVQSDVKSG